MSLVWVHGGVSGLPRTHLPDLSAAVSAGAACADALDAVEAAVCVLEDDERLNAGYGSVLTRAGTLEMDAGLMDGARGRAGAVCGVDVRNPVRLARRVMDATPHVLMTGTGAMALAHGLPRLEDTSPARRAQWDDAMRAGGFDDSEYGSDEFVDTVGAIALDDGGRLAAASSTGGVFGKLPGRVGDAPVPGAGFYASPAAAAVGTGLGEAFLQSLACARLVTLIEGGIHPQAACETVVGALAQRTSSAVAVLTVDREGRAGACFRGGSWSVFGPQGAVAASPWPTGP